jgi:hypothetical protein
LRVFFTVGGTQVFGCFSHQHSKLCHDLPYDKVGRYDNFSCLDGTLGQNGQSIPKLVTFCGFLMRYYPQEHEIVVMAVLKLSFWLLSLLLLMLSGLLIIVFLTRK